MSGKHSQSAYIWGTRLIITFMVTLVTMTYLHGHGFNKYTEVMLGASVAMVTSFAVDVLLKFIAYKYGIETDGDTE
jgi:hypothetical protein